MIIVQTRNMSSLFPFPRPGLLWKKDVHQDLSFKYTYTIQKYFRVNPLRKASVKWHFDSLGSYVYTGITLPVPVSNHQFGQPDQWLLQSCTRASIAVANMYSVPFTYSMRAGVYLPHLGGFVMVHGKWFTYSWLWLFQTFLRQKFILIHTCKWMFPLSNLQPVNTKGCIVQKLQLS